jgi:hypothetical protein
VRILSSILLDENEIFLDGSEADVPKIHHALQSHTLVTLAAKRKALLREQQERSEPSEKSPATRCARLH